MHFGKSDLHKIAGKSDLHKIAEFSLLTFVSLSFVVRFLLVVDPVGTVFFVVSFMFSCWNLSVCVIFLLVGFDRFSYWNIGSYLVKDFVHNLIDCISYISIDII